MGVSTDAMLVYGYVWEDEFDLLGSHGEDDEDEEYGEDEGGEKDWADVIAAKRGLSDPWGAYPAEFEGLPYEERERRGNEWVAAHRAEIDAYSAAKEAIEEEYGVEVDSHGSDGWTVPVVKVAGAGHTASRGDPQQLTADDLAVDPGWDAKLTRFVTDLGIDTSEAKGPGWFLASWWG